jgi:O-antigen ligase
MTFKNQIQASLLICWILILLSINSNFYELNQFYKYKILSTENILNVFNYLRFYIPFVIVFFLTILFIFIKKKFNYILFLFFIYFFYQFILVIILNYQINGTLKTNIGERIKNYQLIANAISTLFIFCFSNALGLKNFYKNLLLILITFIALISIFFTSQLIFEFISEKKLFYIYTSKTLGPEQLSLSQATPRVTGLSRMLLLIFFLFYFIQLSNPKKKFIKYYSLTILFTCVFFIYGMQSRGSWIGILLIIFIDVFINKKNLKKTLTILLVIFTAIFFYEINLKIKSYSIKNVNTNELHELHELKKNQERLVSTHSTSGRTEIWTNIITIIKEDKIIFGKGPQSDRHLLSKYLTKNKEHVSFTVYENNASNALLYSYLCAGIIGFLILICIYINTIKLIYKNIFIIKNFSSKNILINFSTITLLYLLIRSIFENSFSLFSVDFVFFILSYFISLKKNKI